MKLKKMFGLKINDLNMRSIMDVIKKYNCFSYIVTPNVQHIVELSKNDYYCSCYKQASLTLCDSRIVQLISILLGDKIKNVVPGSDLTRYMFESFTGSERIMVVGPSIDDIEKLRETYSLKYLYHYQPPMGFINKKNEIEKTIEAILEVKPEYLFLAVGFPRQEILAYILKERSDFKCVAFCIGASIDFITGKQSRAPLCWQKWRLEWLYRFIHDPRRLFRRYFIDTWSLVPLIISEFRKGK